MQPVARLSLPPDLSASWLVAGDLDGDGTVEFVTARSHQYWVGAADHHHTATVCAWKLSGELLWRWGAPGWGSGDLWHDVACQIIDWDGDGRLEVVLATAGWLVELDGATGQERRRLPLPPDATDSLTFARLSGGPRRDVIAKTRYTQLWAYTYDGEPLWTAEQPGGYPTAHQPYLVELDDNGRDCVLAGYVMLNPDGSPRWTMPNADCGGHLDTARVLRRGDRPEDIHLVATYCGAGRLVAVDGCGQLLWEQTGHHFESIDIGRMTDDVPAPQIAVDLTVPTGQREVIWVLDADGHTMAEVVTRANRHHDLFDWDGDGFDELVVAVDPVVYNARGEAIARLEVDPADELRDCVPLRLTADGPLHVALTTMTGNALYLFECPAPVSAVRRPEHLGVELNATLY